MQRQGNRPPFRREGGRPWSGGRDFRRPGPPSGPEVDYRALVEFVAGLNVEEQTDLLALIWLGRGDYELDEWDAADLIQNGPLVKMLSRPGVQRQR